VALNFQTSDDPLLINDGLFRQRGGRGYVPKPPGVLGKPSSAPGDAAPARAACGGGGEVLDDVMDRFEELACGEASTRKLLSKVENDAILRAQLEAKERALKEASRPLSLRIRVLSGRCLPKPRGAKSGETIDPYVHVTLHDVVRGKDAKATYASTTNTTHAVNDNGFCPVWNEAAFKEYLVHSPEVAQLQFTLYESDIGRDDKVACAVIPLSCLRSGYRSVQLYDMNGTRTGPFGMACLLVEIRQGKAPLTAAAT
jgi:phosphatidylinositol phospholipase C delta